MRRSALFFACLFVLLAACRKEPGLKPESAHRPGAGPLKFAAPPGWIPESPSSSSRRAQYRLARAPGDAEDAEVAVFYFQGGGGTPEANVERWIGQFGREASASVRKETARGIPLTVVDVRGTYADAMGMPAKGPKERFRMIAAVAETPAGPWFVKLTGPMATVAKWEASFEAFLESARQEPPAP